MSRHLLVLGNSHVAALKSAWDAHARRWPRLRLSFFAAHGDYLLDTAVEAGELVPTSAAARHALIRLNGRDRVRLADHDGFVIAGGTMGILRSCKVHGAMRWPGLPSLEKTEDLADLPLPLVSRAQARALTVEMLTGHLGTRLTAILREGSRNPIWLTSQPRPSAKVLRMRHHRPSRTLRLAHYGGDGAVMSGLHDQAGRAAMAAAGGDWIAQPPATIDRHLFTDPRYMLGAVRLSAAAGLPQPEADTAHGNERYGAAILDALSERLG